MYEVEVKGRLTISPDAAIQRLLTAGFEFYASLVQHDFIFARMRSEITTPGPGSTVARLRQEKSAATLTVKIQGSNELECTEYQTGVEHPAETISILIALGMTEMTQVRKRRWAGKRDNVTACVDEVEILGAFVELERLYSIQPPAGTQQQLGMELDEIFPNSYVRIFHGYDRLMLLHDGRPGHDHA